jgi:hypothetical protein
VLLDPVKKLITRPLDVLVRIKREIVDEVRDRVPNGTNLRR